MKTTFAILAAVGLAATAVPASAEQIDVTYEDLDLSNPAGQKTLSSRIEKAAREVCGYTVETGTRMRAPAARECYKEAKAKANLQFAALVTAAAKGG